MIKQSGIILSMIDMQEHNMKSVDIAKRLKVIYKDNILWIWEVIVDLLVEYIENDI